MRQIGAIVITLLVVLGAYSVASALVETQVCEEKLFGLADFKVYACDIKKDTSGVKAPIKNACYGFDTGIFIEGSADFYYHAERPRFAMMSCSCEPTGFNFIEADQSNFFLCNGTAHNPFTWEYEPAGFRGKAFIQNGKRKILGEFQMGRDVWKIKCRVDNNVCPQEPEVCLPVW